jgi:hypothetical protein
MCIPLSKWLEFFLTSMYTQIKTPHKILVFSDHFYYYFNFLFTERDKKVNYIIDPIDFFIYLHKILTPRTHETMCKILGPFQIVSG